MFTKEWKVGTQVTFGCGIDGYPCWDNGWLRQDTFSWKVGEITSVSRHEILVKVPYGNYKGESAFISWSWFLSHIDKEYPDDIRLLKSKSTSKGVKVKRDLPKNHFYVIVDEGFKNAFGIIPTGFVSKACRPSNDNFSEIYLLDANPNPNFLTGSTKAGWLEVSKISKTSYYKHRKSGPNVTFHIGKR